jgi:hypothetical protein
VISVDTSKGPRTVGGTKKPAKVSVGPKRTTVVRMSRQEEARAEEAANRTGKPLTTGRAPELKNK